MSLFKKMSLLNAIQISLCKCAIIIGETVMVIFNCPYLLNILSDIRETAKAVSYSLLRLVSQQAESPTDDPSCALDTESVIKALVGSVGQGSATPSKVAALTWLHHLNMKMPAQVMSLISINSYIFI